MRFYLVAILFIVFDLEAAFLFPWAVSLMGTGWAGWVAMMIFLAELGARPGLCVEEGSARMGVMLDPAANPHPTEEEIARAAGLVPGSAEEAKFLADARGARRKGLPRRQPRRSRSPGRGPAACGG